MKYNNIILHEIVNYDIITKNWKYWFRDEIHYAWMSSHLDVPLESSCLTTNARIFSIKDMLVWQTFSILFSPCLSMVDLNISRYYEIGGQIFIMNLQEMTVLYWPAFIFLQKIANMNNLKKSYILIHSSVCFIDYIGFKAQTSWWEVMAKKHFLVHSTWEAKYEKCS